MISFEEALRIVDQESWVLGKENIPLQECCGRVLAEDVLSDTDMPPFDKSAMDGFACRHDDLGQRLEIVETVTAGDIPRKRIEKNQCSRIMTGARVPEGADCVVMVEHTETEDNRFIRFTGSKTSVNIAFMGEDLKKGDRALARGTLLRPQHIAILASTGCVRPAVYRQPRVAILTTGDEIVEPDVRPGGTCIRNSNGPQLVAQINGMSAIADYHGIVKDTPELTDSAIKSALSGNDTVIITGGVSMGDFDFVPSVLVKNEVELFFEKVAVKPGRPTVFGRRGKVSVFGLPGNPVSSFTIFELMVKPHLYRMMGHDYRPPVLRLPIGVDYIRKKADRISWAPVYIDEEGMVIPVDYHGSAHIHSLSDAWGLLGVPKDVFGFKKGELVNVRQI
jgi:molybdopterin molybdotransferase